MVVRLLDLHVSSPEGPLLILWLIATLIVVLAEAWSGVSFPHASSHLQTSYSFED